MPHLVRTGLMLAMLSFGAWSVLVSSASASSSIDIGMPRLIGVNQQFNLTISGSADGSPLNHPDARFRVVVAGASGSFKPECLNPRGTVQGNPGLGFILFANSDVPSGGFSFNVPIAMPQVGDWTICASVAGLRFTSSPQGFDFKPVAATVRVTHQRQVIRQKAVDVLFSPGTVAGDGFGLGVASIVATENGAGLTNRTLNLQPDSKPASPRAVVCDTRSGGRLLWPGSRFSDGTRSVTGFPTRTDSSGAARVKVLTGTQSGRWSLAATLGGEATVFDLKELQIGPGGASGLNDGPALVTQVGRDFMEGASPRFAAGLALRQGDIGGTADRQRALLELLATARSAGAGILAGVGFGPIRAADGRAGVLLYPRGTIVRAPSGAITPGTVPTARQVIDVDALGRAIASSQTVGGIFRFPDLTGLGHPGVVTPLSTWQGGGPAVVGLAKPLPNEDLAWFGYPEPPALGAPGRADFDGCLDLGLGGWMAEVHSPVRAVLRDGAGRALGLGPSGARLDVPGGIVSAPAGGVARYFVPAGSYRLELTGTGSGPATVVLDPPGSATPSVFAFRARAGAAGSVALGGRAAPRALTYAGKRVAASAGVGLRVSGAPRSLPAGKRRTVRITVRDQFGKAVAGASVQASGGGRTFRSAADARGRATLTVVGRRGTLAVSASAPGHRTARVTVRVV